MVTIKEMGLSARRSLLWLAAVAATAIAAMTPAAASTITYYHNDLAGSPVAATNSSAQVIWRESYRPYGERLTKSAAAKGNDVWFTSRRQDSTGLVYMGARYYDPVTGRFVSTDPKGFDEGSVHSFNRYAYANNNPFRFTDRDGRAPTPIDAAFLLYDVGKLGYEWLSGGDVKGAAVDVGLSAAAILVPLPGAALAIKAERAVEAARGAEEVGRGVAAGLKDGDSLPTSKALDGALDHLGGGYTETHPGVFKSADGRRRVRMTDDDLARIDNHSGAPHMNFETGETRIKPNGKESFNASENKHIFLPEER
jgi:RHS repeat-associated protein